MRIVTNVSLYSCRYLLQVYCERRLPPPRTRVIRFVVVVVVEDVSVAIGSTTNVVVSSSSTFPSTKLPPVVTFSATSFSISAANAGFALVVLLLLSSDALDFSSSSANSRQCCISDGEIVKVFLLPSNFCFFLKTFVVFAKFSLVFGCVVVVTLIIVVSTSILALASVVSCTSRSSNSESSQINLARW